VRGERAGLCPVLRARARRRDGDGRHSDLGAALDDRWIPANRLLLSQYSEAWSQDSAGLPTASEAGDRFGAALALGHYDLDPFPDLAIGIPGQAVAGQGVSILGAGNGDPAGADPQCAGKPWRNQEAASSCGLGAELVLLMLFVGTLHRRRERAR
jgi:hypothetical protein